MEHTKIVSKTWLQGNHLQIGSVLHIIAYLYGGGKRENEKIRNFRFLICAALKDASSLRRIELKIGIACEERMVV